MCIQIECEWMDQFFSFSLLLLFSLCLSCRFFFLSLSHIIFFSCRRFVILVHLTAIPFGLRDVCKSTIFAYDTWFLFVLIVLLRLFLIPTIMDTHFFKLSRLGDAFCWFGYVWLYCYVFSLIYSSFYFPQWFRLQYMAKVQRVSYSNACVRERERKKACCWLCFFFFFLFWQKIVFHFALLYHSHFDEIQCSGWYDALVYAFDGMQPNQKQIFNYSHLKRDCLLHILSMYRT